MSSADGAWVEEVVKKPAAKAWVYPRILAVGVDGLHTHRYIPLRASLGMHMNVYTAGPGHLSYMAVARSTHGGGGSQSLVDHHHRSPRTSLFGATTLWVHFDASGAYT